MAILNFVSSVISIVGFVAFSSSDFSSLGWWQRAALLLAFMAIVSFSVHTFLERRRRRLETFVGDEKFHAFMAEWIANSDGDTVIVSDMFSWSCDARVCAAVEAKARAAQLILVMRSPTEFSRKLKDLGARVSYYGDTRLIPKSRFTVVSADTHHRRVAVGWPGKSKRQQRHVFVYEEGRDPFVGAAMDLVDALSDADDRRARA